MIFIPTCSQDTTTDLVIKELNPETVFRFNIDKPDDFSWDFNANGFCIIDKISNKKITEKTLTSFYLRKPMYFDSIDIPKYGCVENWRREETEELFKDFYRECQSRGLVSLIESKNSSYGKLRQLLIAKKYFRVAPWHFFHGEIPQEMQRGRWVVKSISSAMIGEGKVFFVKEVEPKLLDLNYPWFMQERIYGEEEVTVVYIDGKMYAANYPRNAFNTEDSRKSFMENPTVWPHCELSKKDEESIRGFMNETGYRFGRFDFIRKNGELWFLELNPNGQWAWLDENNERGLISMVADAIKKDDKEHAILRR